ncbi:hypothetical protein OHA70_12305 [Kribbella sp. NBC_00382]|uniref:SIS domain-containing protein n=1 Tax=Kribbella sp. NBC_00382 TaxID=2975967 RepID=UPI002E1DFF8C
MKYPEGIAAQPAALATSLASLQLPSYKGGLIALVGIGASEHAAQGAATAWRAAGLQAVAIPASSPPVAAALTLLISESGRSTEVLAHNPSSRTIALTNFPDSPLAAAADEVILLNSGPDSPAYTTGYTATLQALGVLGDHWSATTSATAFGGGGRGGEGSLPASAKINSAGAADAESASAGGTSTRAAASAHGTAAAAPSASTAPGASTAPSASTAPGASTVPSASTAPGASTAPSASTGPGASNALASGVTPSVSAASFGDTDVSVSPFDWTALPALVSSALAAPLGAASAFLDEARLVDVVASGVSVATAGEGGLLLRESGRLHTAVHETRNYLHGPMEILDRETTCLLIGDGREVQLACDVREYGTKVVLVTTREVESSEGLVVIKVPKASNGLAQAVLEMVVVQRLGWEVARKRGLQVDGFRHRQSDTKVS